MKKNLLFDIFTIQSLENFMKYLLSLSYDLAFINQQYI